MPNARRPMPVGLADIEAARERIRPYVRTTPLHEMDGLRLKLENLQVTGSFKARGAFNYVLVHRAQCAGGIVTASSGNHGQAVAHVARTLGLRAVVVVPEDVVAAKADAITAFGGELIRHGRYSEERIAFARDLAARRRLRYVPPFDDPDIIAGQGTAGLEIVEQLPDVQAVVVPVSGGGLLSGIAAAVKSLRPQAVLIGAEPAGANRFQQSRAAGTPIVLKEARTVADGLRVLTPGRLTWEMTSRYVDRFVSATEAAILGAVRRLLLDAHVVAEPSGAVSVACVLEDRLAAPLTVAVVSGGNVDLPLLQSALS